MMVIVVKDIIAKMLTTLSTFNLFFIIDKYL